jgi:Family of unknown function (DUF5996)
MSANITVTGPEDWPELPLAAWQDTYKTLHMWSQIVGKVRLALSPMLNQWWEVPLYVNAVGLTTSPIPYAGGIFEVQFDFIDHKLTVQTNHSTGATMKLAPRSVADFYAMFMEILAELRIPVKIWPMPVEIPDPIAFDQDTQHKSYDPEYANRFWRILVSTDCVFKEFRARFIGKSSPSHFFWGSFDLAVTRFSGRRAPERVGVDPITQEAYSQEVISGGWWPGGGDIAGAAFYAYAAPEPEGFSQQPVRPEKAFYHPPLKEFLLMYDDLRQASSPRATLLEFLQSTYDAGADTGKWNRKELEKAPI